MSRSLRGSRWLLSLVLGSVWLAACGSEDSPGTTSPKALGAPCGYHLDCQSGLCNGSTGVCAPSGDLLQGCTHFKCSTGTDGACTKCNAGLECGGSNTCTHVCSSDSDCQPGVCNPSTTFCEPACDPAFPVDSQVCLDGHQVECAAVSGAYCDHCGCAPGYSCGNAQCDFLKPQVPGDMRLLPLETGRAWTYDLTPPDPEGLPVRVVVGELTDGSWGVSWMGANAGLSVGTDPDQVAATFATYEEQLLDTPVTAGHSWDAGFGDGTTFAWSEEGSVSTPAGTFEECWRKTSSYGANVYEIFCRGVGLVRFSSGGTVGELKTTNFLPGQTTY